MKLWQLSPGRAAPTTLSAWVALYHELLARPFDQPHVLVLDGLDEVKDWSLRPYLNVELPVNLKLVVTIRDVGQPWAEEYGFPDKQTHHLALDGLTRADVAEVLRMAGPVATAFAGDAKLLDRVVDVTTPSDAVAGSDPLYVTFLADDIEKKQVTAANIAATPRKLEAYLALWWKAIQTQAKADVAARDLLGTLAAALGPVGRDDLAAMHPSLVSNWMDDPLSRVTGGLRRAVAGSDADGYAFAHPRFRDYVRRYPEIKGYEEKLVAYCRGWREHDKRWYAPRYTIRHFAKAGDFDALFATLLDDTFQAAQAQALASVRQTLDDLATAITIASDRDRFLDLLRCAGSHRRLAKAEGIARSIFANVAEGQFAAAAKAIDGYGFAKTSSAWVLALRCHLVGSAARADDGPAAKMLIEASGRQLGLSCHGAALHTTTLCDTLIAGALCRLPDLAADVGVDPSWAPAVLAALNLPSVDTATRGGLLADLDQRIGTLEATLGENPENPEYIDEVRAGEYMSHLRQSLIGVAGEAEGMILIRRALVAVQHNPYPRYRDIGLVAIGAAALAVPDATWAAARIEEILETGLEKEGMTFTFDLATQLATEAARRGLPTSNLAEYLKTAADSGDRWGTRMRSTSAWAAAQFTQGDAVSAFATLQSAAAFDEGFAGYMSAHLLSLASRWSEFDAAPRIAALGLMPKALVQAQRVRDPRFRQERQSLVGLFGQWLALAPPDWAELSAMLHRTADADTRRAYKDLVTARWVADDRRDHWGQVVVATLADATALDFVLARWAAYAIRRHRSGIRELPDSALGEALRLCEQRFAVSHPWESTLAAEYA